MYICTCTGTSLTVKGNINGLVSGEKVFLTYRFNKNEIKDSSVITDGNFEFKGKIDIPLKASLSTDNEGHSEKSKDFYLEPNQTTLVTAETIFKDAKIDGGPVQTDFILLSKITEKQDNKYDLLVKEFMALREAKDNEGIKNMDAKFDVVDLEKKVILKKFVTDKPASFISFSSVLEISYMIDDEFLILYDLIDPLYKSSERGKELASQIAKSKKNVCRSTA